MKPTSLATLSALVVIGTLFLASSANANACCLIPCDRSEDPNCQSGCALILNKNTCPPYPSCGPMACALDAMGNKLRVDIAKVNTIKAKAVVEQDEMDA